MAAKRKNSTRSNSTSTRRLAAGKKDAAVTETEAPAEEEAGPTLEELQAEELKLVQARNKAKTPAERVKIQGDLDRVAGKIAQAMESEREAMQAEYKDVIVAALAKAKLPEAPFGIDGFQFIVNRNAETGAIESQEVVLLTAGSGRTRRKARASAPRSNSGSGFRVAGVGESGSWSGAGRIIKESLGQHPAVRGSTFWKDQNGKSVKEYQDENSSWSAPTGSKWYANVGGNEYELTVTR